MSKFFKALEQAERDRDRTEATGRPAGSTQNPPTAGPVGVRTLATGPERSVPGTAPDHYPEKPGPVAPESAADLNRRRAVSVTDPVADDIDEHLVSLLAPTAFAAEQYRAFRHVVEQRKRAAGLSLLAVSSPADGDGKTTTAINLAGALAQAADTRVLLVDADLRRPALAAHIGLARPGSRALPGLIDLIADARLPLDQVVQRRPDFNLTILPAGGTPAAPYELLQAPRFAELLVEARGGYDYVVLDTPPLVIVPDCRIIEKWVDGIVIVVRAHRTPRKLLEEALNLTEPAKILGLVFNHDDRPLAGYYRGYPHQRAPASGQATNGHASSRWSRFLPRASWDDGAR